LSAVASPWGSLSQPEPDRAVLYEEFGTASRGGVEGSDPRRRAATGLDAQVRRTRISAGDEMAVSVRREGTMSSQMGLITQGPSPSSVAPHASRSARPARVRPPSEKMETHVDGIVGGQGAIEGRDVELGVVSEHSRLRRAGTRFCPTLAR